jgi:3-deoxy-D-arabino-heptulosonate 7-phosphate (DAHP) synthase
VTDEQADLLHETIEEFLWAANYVVDAAWDGEWAEARSSVLHERPTTRYATTRGFTVRVPARLGETTAVSVGA